MYSSSIRTGAGQVLVHLGLVLQLQVLRLFGLDLDGGRLIIGHIDTYSFELVYMYNKSTVVDGAKGTRTQLFAHPPPPPNHNARIVKGVGDGGTGGGAGGPTLRFQGGGREGGGVL